MAIECLILGAGQEVGKSCVVVTIGGKRIMFDCGMHMGYVDRRRYPDFSLISDSGEFDSALSCIVITHFHLDHVGALPYFTEVCGYKGPIFMTYPTKALAPLMLEDYRKVMVERRGEEEQFTYEHIMACMDKVTTLDLKQTVHVDKDLQIRAYYAGHVLGAAMIYAKVGDNAMVYTGDYNMTPDRHLGAAQIDRLLLDVLITESTYATTIRDSKYAREREFLKAVHKCVSGGGKVLIPTFALGRAQELCILLNDYWERMNLNIPIYLSAGLTIQANMYYKMLIGWTSQKIKDSHATHNSFDFKHVHPFDRSYTNAPGPCVLFATPGMISGGFSLEVFKQWAPSEMNLITLPGYCVAGTIGHKLMSGKPTRIDLDKDTQIDVRCQIHQLSFSPHTDAKGIMDLVGFLSPKNVILVHGEKPRMEILKDRIQTELGIKCYVPANKETVIIPTSRIVKTDATKAFIRSCSALDFDVLCNSLATLRDPNGKNMEHVQTVRAKKAVEGILMMDRTKKPKIVCEKELMLKLDAEEHKLRFAYCCPVYVEHYEQISRHSTSEPSMCIVSASSSDLVASSVQCLPAENQAISTSSLLHTLLAGLEKQFCFENVKAATDHLQINSFEVRICSNNNCPYRLKDKEKTDRPAIYFCCSWSAVDHSLAWQLLAIMKGSNSSSSLEIGKLSN